MRILIGLTALALLVTPVMAEGRTYIPDCNCWIAVGAPVPAVRGASDAPDIPGHILDAWSAMREAGLDPRAAAAAAREAAGTFAPGVSY